MEGFEVFYFRTHFMIELLLGCVVFSVPLARRRGFWLRAIPGAAVCLILCFVFPRASVTLILRVLVAAGWAWLCFAVSLQDALYGAACAYASQHICYTVREVGMYLLNVPHSEDPPLPTLSMILLSALILAALYFFFARKMADGGRYTRNARHSLRSMAVVLSVVLILSTAAQRAYVEQARPMYIICHLYALSCCLFILNGEVSYIKRFRLEQEVSLHQMLLLQQKEQYQMTKETIELIDRKCHDLKHQMAALRSIVPEEARERYLAQVESSIQIYDSTLETGNEVLNTVLTEKSLYCEAHQITMTCVADGRPLAFMDSMDVYAIFGNALDNAIESVIHLPDPEKRVIAVSVWMRSGLLLFQFENYFEGDLDLRDGLPATTKEQNGYHGFGLKSIRATAEKYNGQMSVHMERKLFILRVSIPLP